MATKLFASGTLLKNIVYVCMLIVLSGCGGSSNNLAEVTGKVTLDGKPLTTGSVMTMPEHGRGARGTIDSTGSFTLSTNELGSGASIGLHHIGVVAVEEAVNLSPEAPRKSLIPTKYASPETSGLTIDVKQGEANEAVLELSSGQ